jgi:hypothetical protein
MIICALDTVLSIIILISSYFIIDAMKLEKFKEYETMGALTNIELF